MGYKASYLPQERLGLHGGCGSSDEANPGHV
jgi:hypothetical protein